MAKSKQIRWGLNSRIRTALIGAGLALAAALATFAPAGSKSAAAAEGQATATIEVPDIGCASCSLEVRRALKSVGGLAGIEPAEDRSRLVVTFAADPSRPLAYVEALKKAGFAKARLVTRG